MRAWLCRGVFVAGLAAATALGAAAPPATGDVAMDAAVAKARSTLDGFLRLKANPPDGTSHYALRVRFRDEHGAESLWVQPFEVTADGFAGIVEEAPAIVTDVAAGQPVRFARDQVSDWMYRRADQGVVGAFTMCVALRRMPRARANQYRDVYGFGC